MSEFEAEEFSYGRASGPDGAHVQVEETAGSGTVG